MRTTAVVIAPVPGTWGLPGLTPTVLLQPAQD
jgi:hypothetical protein